MIPHAHAKRLLDTLAGDPETIAEIARYIEHQASLERMDNPSLARLANAAERRSCEAISRSLTLAGDVGSLHERLTLVEATTAEFDATIAGLLMMLAEKGVL
jgi:hypothetical protein